MCICTIATILLSQYSTISICVVAIEADIEAERQSLYKAIGYAKGKALEPFAKEVCKAWMCTIIVTMVILSIIVHVKLTAHLTAL